MQSVSPSPYESTLYEIVTALQSSPPSPPVTDALTPASAHAASCVMCGLTVRSVERSLRTFLSEYVNDPQTREVFRRAGGFCMEHTRVLAGIGDALAIAILYSDLARLTRERHQQEAQTRGLRRGLARLSRAGSGRDGAFSAAASSAAVSCPGCVAAAEASDRYVRSLAAGLDKPEAWAALEAGPELCAGHIEQILSHAAPNHAARLRQLEIERLARLQAELDEIIRKNDYRFRGEPWGAEKDAWLRALTRLRK